MKYAICLVLVLASMAQARPRYILVPIEDVQFMGDYAQRLPVVRMPSLARQARDIEEEEEQQQYDILSRQKFASFQRRSEKDSQASGSNAYGAAPAAPGGPDHVDYGAYTGGYGAFGWYTDHPVLLQGYH